MFNRLQIGNRRERWMVGAADVALTAAVRIARPFASRRAERAAPDRVLLLRLERIGDLLMARPAIAAVRRLLPRARIDLVVGSWNDSIARLFEEVDRVETLDAAWLARGARTPGFASLVRQARTWRTRQYDLAVNFEGDIRSHILMACSGAAKRVGFDMAGGGPLLTDRVAYDPSRHVAHNLLTLVAHALDVPDQPLPPAEPRLKVSADAREAARALLVRTAGNHRPVGQERTCIGIQVGGGRRIKQWDPARFAELGGTLATKYGATLVFTGSAEDRPLVDVVLAELPSGVNAIDLCGRVDLPTLAAVLERLSVFITGDTGPMHLAAAVGTPLVAIFGPSDPGRWGPVSTEAHIVHSDVLCRPCNRIRRPPSHCVGKIPDCLAAVATADVLRAVEQAMAGMAHHPAAASPRQTAEAIDGR